MKSHGLPAICLGPTGNTQGTYSFLNLSTGLVIKCSWFVELPAPDSVIQRVNDLAANSGVSTTLIFADRHKTPFDWSDNDADPPVLDPTKMVVYPQLPAEMPGVLLKCHIPIPGDNSPFDKPYEPDWFELADKAAHTADLDNAEQLPPPLTFSRLMMTMNTYMFLLTPQPHLLSNKNLFPHIHQPLPPQPANLLLLLHGRLRVLVVPQVALMITTCSLRSLKNAANHQSIPITPLGAQMLN
jgi:hypothetical protein